MIQNKHPENKKENKSDFVAEEEEIQDWAVMVNVKGPVKDFDSKVPVMAKSVRSLLFQHLSINLYGLRICDY